MTEGSQAELTFLAAQLPQGATQTALGQGGAGQGEALVGCSSSVSTYWAPRLTLYPAASTAPTLAVAGALATVLSEGLGRLDFWDEV